MSTPGVKRMTDGRCLQGLLVSVKANPLAKSGGEREGVLMGSVPGMTWWLAATALAGASAVSVHVQESGAPSGLQGPPRGLRSPAPPGGTA